MVSIKDKVKLGEKIRDREFSGNNYSQLGYLMEGLMALNILRKETSTVEEIAWAEAKITELEEIQARIQALLTEE